MQGLYNKKVAVPSVLDTLSALFIVPSAIYMIANNLILFSPDSTISDITFRHPITADLTLIAHILVKSILSLYKYYDYVNTVHCLK